MSRRQTPFLRDRRGVAATEFALILPVLTILLFGFYEAGRIYWSYNVIQSSARDAARYAARMPITCDGGGTATFTDGTDQAEIQNLTRTGTIDGTGDPLVPGWDDNTMVTVTPSCVDNTGGAMSGRYAGYTQIPIVTITATPPYTALFADLVGFELDTISVSNAQAWTE